MYLGIKSEFRDFQQVLPKTNGSNIFFSPIDYDNEFVVYEDFLLEVLLGLREDI